MNKCHCDWFNKEADWLKAEQNKVRQESQTRRMLGRRVESGNCSQPEGQEMNVHIEPEKVFLRGLILRT